MIRQEYNIHKGDGRMGQMLFADALKKFRPDVGRQMEATYEAGLYHNPIMWGTEILVNAFDESEIILQDQWNRDHREYRDGVKWFDGMTELQARIESERYDREETHGTLMKNTDPWAMHNIGAMFASALHDPLTFFPFVGGFTKAGAMTTRIANRMGRLKKVSNTISPARTSILGVIGRPFKPVGYWMTEAGLAETTYQIIKGVAKETSGKDVDYMAALMDISIVTLAGGALGLFPMAKNFRKNLSMDELYDAMGNATNQLKQKGFVGTGGSGTKKPKSEPELEAEYNQKMSDFEDTSFDSDSDIKHAVFSHAQDLGEDVVKFAEDIIDRFKRCIKK